MIRDVSQQYDGFGLGQLLSAGGEAIGRMEELERELAALDAQWQTARYEHEQDAIANRMVGPHFEYANYDYDFRQMVSGGGPFFSHRLKYEFDVVRYGAMFGVGVEQRLGDGFGWRAEAYVLPSWRDLELRGRQSGSALGSAKAKDSDNGLGLHGGLEAGLWVRLSPGIRLDASVGGTWRSDAPAVRYPNAGGEKLRARTGGAFDGMARAQITIRLSDLPVSDRIH